MEFSDWVHRGGQKVFNLGVCACYYLILYILYANCEYLLQCVK